MGRMKESNVEPVAEFMEDPANHVIWRRLFAANIDLILWIFTLMIPDYFLGNDLYQKTLFIWLPLTFFICFALPEGLTGYTLGKWIFTARVLNSEGKIPGVKAGTLSTFVRFFEGTFAFLPAAIVAFFSKRSQRIGDMAAKTYVMSSKNSELFLCHKDLT